MLSLPCGCVQDAEPARARSRSRDRSRSRSRSRSRDRSPPRQPEAPSAGCSCAEDVWASAPRHEPIPSAGVSGWKRSGLTNAGSTGRPPQPSGRGGRAAGATHASGGGAWRAPSSSGAWRAPSSGGYGSAGGGGRRRGAPAKERDELALCRAVLDGTVAASHAARMEAVAARACAEEAAAHEHAMRQAAALRQQRQASAAAWAARREEAAAASAARDQHGASSASQTPSEEGARRGRAEAAAGNAAETAASGREARELSEARARYRARWGALLAWQQAEGPLPTEAAEVVGIGPAAPPAASPAASSLSFGAMPWPSEAWARAWGDAAATDLSAVDVRRIVLPDDGGDDGDGGDDVRSGARAREGGGSGNAKGTAPTVPTAAARRRRALQDELRRWHPDKFVARFGGALREAERDDILAGVKRVSQCLTELLRAEPKLPVG